jgi:6-phosphogluconolactonase (cycloisomerase 2 family)
MTSFIKIFFAFALLLSTFVVGGGATAEAHGDSGAVYVLTNQAAGNGVAVFDRASDGALTPSGTYSTGGLGTGTGLGSQGALVLSQNGRWLFAVNAGSNDISVFSVDRDGLTLVDRVPSGGLRPISLTVYRDLLYVLNAGGSGNITGFNISRHGGLTPIPGSTRPLSGNAVAPAQVQFSPDGDLLVVTEKTTNLIDTYTVDRHGLANGPTTHPSSGATPFGFAFGKRGTLIVSEANGGTPGLSAVSSYDVDNDGDLTPVSPSAATHQAAACWIVVTKNGKYAYSANAAAGSISGFRVARDGSLTLLTPDGRTGVTGSGTSPIDMALSNNSHYLYVVTSASHGISAFEVQEDGTLTPAGSVNGLPVGAVGIAAR